MSSSTATAAPATPPTGCWHPPTSRCRWPTGRVFQRTSSMPPAVSHSPMPSHPPCRGDSTACKCLEPTVSWPPSSIHNTIRTNAPDKGACTGRRNRVSLQSESQRLAPVRPLVAQLRASYDSGHLQIKGQQLLEAGNAAGRAIFKKIQQEQIELTEKNISV